MTTVSFVEDDAAFAEFLRKLITSSSRLRLVGAHSDAESALIGIPQEKPAVVLMDLQLPRQDGLECIRELRAWNPPLPCHFLVISDYRDDGRIFQALRAGAHGYLSKSRISHEVFEQAVIETAHGGTMFTPDVARRIALFFHEKPKPTINLSNREGEVLHLLSHGRLYKEVADALAISLNTVRKHVDSIYKKLHVNSRAEAIAAVRTPRRTTS